MQRTIFKTALLPAGWAENVELEIDNDGVITSVTLNSDNKKDCVSGYALPAMNNIHSHAFQRAMAGLAEYSTSREDSFWTWRDIMYKIAGHITPDDLTAIASQLYLEMLKAGYVSVAEFHYLHRHGGDNLAMSRAIIEAAKHTQIALCHLPVLYMSSGFGGTPLNDAQQKFGHTVDQFLELLQTLSSSFDANTDQHLGMAFHSLRAVPEKALKECLENLPFEGPIHIHISEQEQEVNDSLAFSGKRPVQWLMDNVPVNENWCFIHATHINESEIKSITKSGAVVGLCPTTEANLGDGIFPLGKFMEAGGEIAIGSDSHISVSVVEELRLLEYGQRLLHRRRNLSAETTEIHTGTNLYQKSLRGGARASGFNNGVIAVGKRADIIVLDDQSPLLLGGKKENIVDQFVFSGNVNPVRDVYVAGQKVIADYQHRDQQKITNDFRRVMERLQKILD